MTDAQFARRALIVFSLAAAIALAWVLGPLLLLAFGAIVIAIVIRAGGEFISRHTRLRARWACMVVVVLAAGTLVALGLHIGDQVGQQVEELQRRLPEAFAKVREWMRRNELVSMILPQAGAAGEEAGVSAEDAVKTVSLTFTALAHVVMVVLIAVYMSFNPHLYLRGALALVPSRHRPRVAEGLHIAGDALKRWLLGQFASMVLVGLLTGIGLWIAGVPLAFILGILAGLLEFIPVAGPILAAIPGILLAFSVSPTVALYALLVYIIVQQLESGVIMPLAQRWSVHLPPALGLFAIVVFTLLFGVPGIIFATPLTVVIMVLVQRFWVEENGR